MSYMQLASCHGWLESASQEGGVRGAGIAFGGEAVAVE